MRRNGTISTYTQQSKRASTKNARRDYLKAAITDELSNISQFIPVIGNVTSFALSTASTMEANHAQGLTLTKQQKTGLIAGGAAALAMTAFGYAGMLSELSRIRGNVTDTLFNSKRTAVETQIEYMMNGLKGVMELNARRFEAVHDEDNKLRSFVLNYLSDNNRNVFTENDVAEGEMTINFLSDTKEVQIFSGEKDNLINLIKKRRPDISIRRGDYGEIYLTNIRGLDARNYMNARTIARQNPMLADFYLRQIDTDAIDGTKLISKVHKETGEQLDRNKFRDIMNMKEGPEVDFYYQALLRNTGEGKIDIVKNAFLPDPLARSAFLFDTRPPEQSINNMIQSVPSDT